jgi:hypothetical protein
MENILKSGSIPERKITKNVDNQSIDNYL